MEEIKKLEKSVADTEKAYNKMMKVGIKYILLLIIVFLIGYILGSMVTINWGVHVASEILNISLDQQIMDRALNQYGGKLLGHGYI